MKTLVLGSNSCAGSHYVKYLQENDLFCVATSRSKENEQKFLAYKKSKSQIYIKLDINKDLKKIPQLSAKYDIDCVVNFASQSMVAESWTNPLHWMKTNCTSTIKLLIQLAKIKNLKAYIHFSTPEVYGNTNTWVRENCGVSPSTPYAATRALGDFFVKMWGNKYNLPFIITRAANVYGEGQKLYRIIPRTFHYLNTNKRIPLHGGGKTERSFIHCEDVSRAIITILNSKITHTCFHISPKEKISIKNLVSKICKLENKMLKNSIVSSADRPGKDLKYMLDPYKLQKIGWEPKIHLDDGLDRMRNWYLKNQRSFRESDEKYLHKE